MGLTAVASAVGSRMTAYAQSRPAARRPAPAPAADSAGAPKPPDPDALALLGIVERRYGRHLGAAQLEQVRKELENRLQGGQRLRAVRLANRDEPDFVFRA